MHPSRDRCEAHANINNKALLIRKAFLCLNMVEDQKSYVKYSSWVNKFIRLVQDLNLEEFWWGNIKIQVCCQCKQEINRIRVNKIAIHGTKSKLERESLGPHESVSLSLMGNSPWLEVFNTKLSFFGKTQPIFVIQDNFSLVWFSLSLSLKSPFTVLPL